MKLTLIMAAALVAGTGLAPAQEAAPTRTDLQRHDLSVLGREVVQVIVGFAPGATAARHTFSKGCLSIRWRAIRR
jgi:hypothetical protein